jgi:hypothetical protein
MFHFGSAEDNSEIYKAWALSLRGPAIPDCPLNEMEEKHVSYSLTYARLAYEKAKAEGSPTEVLDLLLRDHDAIFEHLASASDEFKDTVNQGAHIFVNGYSDENVEKYKTLAGLT